MEDILKRAKDGDSEAIREIIEKFNYFIIKQAGKYRIPSYDFEDLLQHGYLSVLEKTIINQVYIKDKTLKDTSVKCQISYRKAIEVKKSALNKLRKFMK